MKTATWLFATAALAGAQLGVSAPAHAFDLNGSWTTQTDLCKKIFSRTGNKTSFAPGSDLYGNGFIIEGNRITGQSAKCDVKSSKQDGAVTRLTATCETGIMVDQFQLTYKVIDDDKFVRLFDNTIETTYVRCPAE